MEWQRRVLDSNLKYTVSRAARGSGKTFTAMQWARGQIGKRVLFLCGSMDQARMTARVMSGLYKDEVLESRVGPTSEARILFRDGTSVFFRTKDQNVRGLLVESLVVDDVKDFNEYDYAYVDSESIEKALILGTESSPYMRYILQTARAMVNHIVVDYMDLLTKGYYEKDFIREMQLTMNSSQFMREFGPWMKPAALKNEDYLYLMNT